MRTINQPQASSFEAQLCLLADKESLNFSTLIAKTHQQRTMLCNTKSCSKRSENDPYISKIHQNYLQLELIKKNTPINDQDDSFPESLMPRLHKQPGKQSKPQYCTSMPHLTLTLGGKAVYFPSTLHYHLQPA